MRLISYKKNEVRGVAVRDGDSWRDLGQVDILDVIARGIDALGDVSGLPVLDSMDVTLLPSVPNPPKIICVGLNYLDHLAESPYTEAPDYPAFFPRYTSSLVAHEASIIRPTLSHELDWEAELAVVIGKAGRHIKLDDALSHVAGYTAFNDGSLRDYQFISAQWTAGKNFDATGGLGPELVTPDELPEGAKGLKVEAILNGEVVQSGNTDDMIFSVAQLIEFASRTMTLEVGTVIATGTPAGIGWARKPPVFMAEGDVIEVRVEGIGTLRNPIKDEVAA